MLPFLLTLAALQARPVVVELVVPKGQDLPVLTSNGEAVTPRCESTASQRDQWCTAVVERPAKLADTWIPAADRLQYRLPQGELERVSFHQPLISTPPRLVPWPTMLLAWVLVLLGLPLTLSGPRSAAPQSSAAPARSWWTGGLATFVAALLAALAFTWPALFLPADALLGRGFDGTGMLWMGWYMGAHFADDGLTSTLTGYPMWEGLYGNDGWLYLGLCRWLPSLASPCSLHLWALLGCAASFLAAERLALACGARRPWSWAAGLVFACNGVAAASLAEGRFYHLAQWPLPLFLLWWRALLQGRGRGVAAGLAWVLCLGTSAYTAILASAAAAWFYLFQRPGLRWHVRLLPVVALSAPAAALFVRTFRAAPFLDNWTSATATLHKSATLAGLLGWSPDLGDLAGFSTPALGFASLALSLVAVRLWPRTAWLPWLSGALLALVLAFGTHTHLSPFHDADYYTPLGWLLRHHQFQNVFRFPVRFLLLTHLALGVLAAMGLTASRPSVSKAVLCGALLVDAFFWSGAPHGTGSQWLPSLHEPRQVTSAAPMLDLLPQTRRRVDYELLTLIHRICVSQTGHGQALPEFCLSPVSLGTPAFQLRDVFIPALLHQETDRVADLLRRDGFRTLVLHPDLFDPADRQLLESSLAALAGAPATDLAGAERRLFYTLDLASPR